jgi:hypothetical protein
MSDDGLYLRIAENFDHHAAGKAPGTGNGSSVHALPPTAGNFMTASVGKTQE